jgi:ATP-dependent phosphoenolpyruvate carboxykinase
MERKKAEKTASTSALEQNRLLYTNAITNPKRRTTYANKKVSKEDMHQLVELARANLKDNETYIWNANINGVTVQLLTNSLHQYDFWVENWFPAPFEAKPDAVIYSVLGIPGRDSEAHFCKATKTIVFFNTDYYGQCKSWALGLADCVLRNQGIHSIHGSCVDMDGIGTLMIAPTGTGKSTHSYKLMELPASNVHSDDWVYVTYVEENGGVAEARAAISERNFYLRTDTAKDIPYLRELFRRCKTENLITRREDCENVSCLEKVAKKKFRCGFDEGEKSCFWCFPNTRAMLDPTWVVGRDRFVKVTNVKYVIFLTRDEAVPQIKRLDADETIQVLKEGRFMVLPGAGPRSDWGKMKNEPWFNPYLLDPDDHFQELSFRKLCEVADSYMVNMAKGSIEENQELIRQIALGKEVCIPQPC